MSLVHRHEPNRVHNLALLGLVLVVFGIIAVAVPLSKVCIDSIFALF